MGPTYWASHISRRILGVQEIGFASEDSGGAHLACQDRVVLDALWSDPTDNDQVLGVQSSPRGKNTCRFGPDRVQDFNRRNGLKLIIRAHECVQHGYEYFAAGQLLTVAFGCIRGAICSGRSLRQPYGRKISHWGVSMIEVKAPASSDPLYVCLRVCLRGARVEVNERPCL